MRRADLFIGRGWLEVVERSDVSTHEQRLARRICWRHGRALGDLRLLRDARGLERRVRAELARLFGEAQAGPLLDATTRSSPRIQAERPEASYREVMALVLAELASESGTELPER